MISSNKALNQSGMPVKHGFLLDMDGVIYRGSELIPGSETFVNKLLKLQIPFMFLTNNSQRSQLDVVTKLRRMGIAVDPHHVFTCAMAAAHFISEQKAHSTAFVIGEGGLLSALHDCGVAIVDHSPDYVIVGEGRQISFEQLEQATRMVMAGAKLIATNLDPNCPTAHGLRPGAGAIVRMIETATGRSALGLGKPSPIMMRMASRQLGLLPEHISMIGDTMETDILGGVQMGFRTVLVLSGGTCADDLDKFAYLPDLVTSSLNALIPLLMDNGALSLDVLDQPQQSRRELAPVWWQSATAKS
jgi:NagD protein